MSVINKMLRDLDSRQAAGTIPTPAQESRTGIASGTLIANDSDRTGGRRVSPRLAVVIAAMVMVLGAAAGWWYLNQNEFLQRKVDQVKLASTPVRIKPVIAAAPGVEPVAAKLPVVQSGAAEADISLKMDRTFKWLPSHAAPARPTAAGTPRVVPERSLNEGARTDRPAASAPATPVVPLAVPQSPSRQSPALDALAQAQSLWSSGSHEAAIDLLREALTAVERANFAGTPSGNNSVLASLARELARMELAEGRASQALEMLMRLEPALSGVADVWAMRANAAQRLGRHEESAAAYRMALKLRPNEARWMLGAAVSLAAQGQTASAAELAEKARAGGVLSPEVATYLRQLGVPLRER